MNHFHFYDLRLETLPREQLRALQTGRLLLQLQEMSANGFYAAKFAAAGLLRKDILTLDDLQKIPFTTKSDLVTDQAAAPPYGTLLSYSLARYTHLHQTSGTTGRPLLWLDTKESWATWLRCWGFVYRAAGVTEDDIIFCAYSFGPYVSHWAAIEGARGVGALTIAGGGLDSEQRLRLMLDRRCTVLLCTPTYALHLLEVARRESIDLRSSAIRVTIHAGEPGASVPNVQRAIEDGWGAHCYDHAGATEVGAWGFGCDARTGAMHLNETDFFFEVIDPATLRPVGEGERGELVVTTLSRPGMPVLRYRTGDLVEMVTTPCLCGRTLARIQGGVIGRADDMLIVRGANLYPSAIDNLVRSLPFILEYEVEIRRVSGMDDLRFRIEVAGVSSGDPVQSLVEAFRAQFNIRIGVERVPAGSLPRYEAKASRFKRLPDPPPAG